MKNSPNLFSIYLIKVDMRIFSHFADYILENGADEYSKLSFNIKMALKIALLMCYSRPFLDNQDKEIQALLTNDFLDEEKIIHNNILEMRNKEVGLSNIDIPDLESIKSKIVHISIPRNNTIPLDFKMVESLKKMSDKINASAIKIVETPDFEHKFCFRGIDLQR